MVRARRAFSLDFKRQVVAEVEGGLLSLSEAGKKYRICDGTIGRWLTNSRVGLITIHMTATEKALRLENELLKSKVGELTMQIDVLKKLEGYARQRKKEGSSVITSKSLAASGGGAK